MLELCTSIDCLKLAYFYLETLRVNRSKVQYISLDLNPGEIKWHFPLCLYQVQFHNNLRCKRDMINIRKDSSSSYLNVDFTSYNVECMTAVMLISLKKTYLLISCQHESPEMLISLLKIPMYMLISHEKATSKTFFLLKGKWKAKSQFLKSHSYKRT